MTEVGWTPMCRQQKLEEGPKFGIICRHIPTGEYWLKQQFDFNGELYDVPPAETYGRVFGEEFEGAQYLDVLFGEGYPDQFTRWGQYKSEGFTTTWDHRAHFEFHNQETVTPEVAPDGEAGSCGWPVI